MAKTYGQVLANICNNRSDARGGLFRDHTSLGNVPLKFHAMSIPDIASLYNWSTNALDYIPYIWWL